MEDFLFYFTTIIIALICVGILYIYLKLYWNLRYWDRRDIQQIKPHFFLGNLHPYIRQNKDFGMMLRNYYNESDGRSCVGLYMLHSPALLLRDPNLIRTVFFNHCGNFGSRKVFAEKEKCPLLDNLYQHSGNEWRSKREKWEKAFTLDNLSGLYETIIVVSVLEDFLNNLCESNVDNSVGINRLLERHLYELTAWTIFGIHVNPIQYPEVTFRMFGRELFRPKFVDKLSLIRDLAVPTKWEWLYNWLNFRRHSKRIEDYYVSLTKYTVESRENISSLTNATKDFMQYLLKWRNRGFLHDNEESYKLCPSGMKHLSMSQISSLAFLTFTSAFPTIASTMVFFLFEIAKNHIIQDKLSREVEELFHFKDGNPEYKDIAVMKYLDNCLNETLRKYPPIPHVIRYCTSDYYLKQENLLIKKGMPILVSILGIHHDPTFYPDPMVFDPDRFNETEMNTRPVLSFVPFGFGPRACLGADFAKAILKVHLVWLVSSYEIYIARRMMKDTEINFENGYLNQANRIHLRFARRIGGIPSDDGW